MLSFDDEDGETIIIKDIYDLEYFLTSKGDKNYLTLNV